MRCGAKHGAVGIKMKFRKAQWPDLLKNSAQETHDVRLAWSAGYPDGGGAFYGMFYGKNAGQTNHLRFKVANSNRLFEKARTIPPGPEREAIYREMNRIFLVNAPWKLGAPPSTTISRIPGFGISPPSHSAHRVAACGYRRGTPAGSVGAENEVACGRLRSFWPLRGAKTLRHAFLNAETAFDPHAVSDLYSNMINDAIFDPLLSYDYLARPAKLKPNAAAARALGH